MSDTAKAARCPDGHDDTVRLLSSFATAGSAAPNASATVGGCCGGACGCAN
jgi:hypothetical protein